MRELLGISLHAIAESLAPKTMRLLGEINNQNVLILIDTSSTHSFIDPYVAKKAKLPMGDIQLTVKVANGGTLSYLGYCKAVPLILQDIHFLANLYVLTLGGCEVVLGVDWPSSLGSILWNFSDLTMQFLLGDVKVKL